MMTVSVHCTVVFLKAIASRLYIAEPSSKASSVLGAPFDHHRTERLRSVRAQHNWLVQPVELVAPTVNLIPFSDRSPRSVGRQIKSITIRELADGGAGAVGRGW